MLGTGVTNPITRHAAVTAASIMSVQAESDGRAILGIGRGDSAVLHIGRKPAPLKEYGAYVTGPAGHISRAMRSIQTASPAACAGSIS